jgi:hypothetical protein
MREHPDETQRLRAECILGWLTFACRPLRYWEVCDGLVFSDERGDMNEETKLGRGVLDICKPLIEDREGQLVGLVHFSVREFVKLEDCVNRELINVQVPHAPAKWPVPSPVPSSCKLDYGMFKIFVDMSELRHGFHGSQTLRTHRQRLP